MVFGKSFIVQEQLFNSAFLFAVLLTVFIIIFSQGIFYTQNFFQNKLDKTILFIEPYFLKKPIRIGMIGINTNIEQVQGHKDPNPPNDLTISKEDNHKAQLTIVT